MNIYVANLSWGTTSDSLKDLFSEFGETATAQVITDRETGRSRGFGFVEMPNDSEAQGAIDKLHETEFEGKTISVTPARPKTDKPRSGGSNRGGGNRGGYGSDNRGGGYGGGDNRRNNRY